MGIKQIPMKKENLIVKFASNFAFYMICSKFVREYFGPGNVLKYKGEYQYYLDRTDFLNYLNNEKQINEKYKIRMQALDKFVMVGFSNENYLQPAESIYFGYFSPCR